MRYEVGYVHRDGNLYPVAQYDALPEAQERGHVLAKELFMQRLPVVITDLDDPERGNLFGMEEEENA